MSKKNLVLFVALFFFQNISPMGRLLAWFGYQQTEPAATVKIETSGDKFLPVQAPLYECDEALPWSYVACIGSLTLLRVPFLENGHIDYERIKTARDKIYCTIKELALRHDICLYAGCSVEFLCFANRGSNMEQLCSLVDFLRACLAIDLDLFIGSDRALGIAMCSSLICRSNAIEVGSNMSLLGIPYATLPAMTVRYIERFLLASKGGEILLSPFVIDELGLEKRFPSGLSIEQVNAILREKIAAKS